MKSEKRNLILLGVITLVLSLGAISIGSASSVTAVMATNSVDAVEEKPVATPYEVVTPEPLPCKIVLNGYFKGEWIFDDSNNGGSLRGVYGYVQCGDRTYNFFKGRWFAPTTTEARPGFLVGTYKDGEFKGFWGSGGEKKGYLKGEYRATTDGSRYFEGKWTNFEGTLNGYLKGTWSPFNTLNIPRIIKNNYPDIAD